MLTLEVLTYIEGHGRTSGTIWNDATCTLTPFKGPDTMLNRIALSISTAGNLIYNEKYEDFKLSLGALNNKCLTCQIIDKVPFFQIQHFPVLLTEKSL